MIYGEDDRRDPTAETVFSKVVERFFRGKREKIYKRGRSRTISRGNVRDCLEKGGSIPEAGCLLKTEVNLDLE